MPAQVVSFLRRARPLSRDWSQDELAEFYRVEAALLQSGMRIETDRGVTDEGDPWFAFCRADDGETFIHFARIDGRYIIAGPAYEGVAQGYDFPELVRDLISRHPLVQPTLQRRGNTNIFMHPAALLIAVVGTAFFKTDAAKAAEPGEGDHKADRRHIVSAAPATVPAPSLLIPGAASQAGAQVALDAAQTLTLVASAMAAMTPATGPAHAAAPLPPLPADAEAALGPSAVSVQSHGQVDHAALLAAAMSAPPAATPHAAPTGQDALGAWLSLAAVLQDLPRPLTVQGPEALASALALLPADAARYVQTAVLPVPPAAPAAAPVQAEVKAVAAPAPAVLMIELTSAALPDVAAVRLVRDLGDGVARDVVVKLEQLPDILAKLIAKGEHLETPAFSLTAPTIELPRDLSADLPALDSAAPVAVDAAAPASPVAPAPIGATIMDKATIDAIIADFVGLTGQTQVAINGHDILIYDSRIMSDTVVQGMSNSVTFSFADGSSISLVGLSQTLHAIGALH